jgi:hypothetical protein
VDRIDPTTVNPRQFSELRRGKFFERERDIMGRWLKIGFIMGLLVLSGFFFGVVSGQVGQSYGVLLSLSSELLMLFLWFFVAALTLTACAGLVATLLRPMALVWIAFALSALAMLIGWEFSLVSGILALAYFLAGSIYANSVVREMNRRITYSERSAQAGQSLLLTALAVVVSGSLCVNYSAHIEREGFSLPERYVHEVEQLVEGPVGAVIPEALQESVLEQFRETFETILGDYINNLLEPYEGYIPLVLAFFVLLLLLPILRMLWWIPFLILSAIQILFRVLGFTHFVYKTTEVQRLVLK